MSGLRPQLVLLLLALAGTWHLSRQLDPGHAVQPFCVRTLGSATQYCWKPGNGPVVLMALRREDAFSRHMMLTVPSMEELLQLTPPGITYVFGSWNQVPREALNDVKQVRAVVEAAVRSLGGSMSLQQSRLAQFQFLASPVPSLDAWLVETLHEWSSTYKVLQAQRLQPQATALMDLPGSGASASRSEATAGLPLEVGRLDSVYAWLPWPTGSALLSQKVDSACGPVDEHFDGSWVLLSQRSKEGVPGCSYGVIITNLQAAGAAGVVVYATSARGQDLELIQPDPDLDADLEPSIPATTVPHNTGLLLAAALRRHGPTNITFADREVPGSLLSIDGLGRLAEVGWLVLPTAAHLAWAAQYTAFRQQQHERIKRQEEEGVLVVPVFDQQVMRPEGPRTTVVLPALDELQQYGRLELDAALDCTGPLDRHCPAWDHVVQLFMCCEDPKGLLPPCDDCTPTVWAQPHYSTLSRAASTLNAAVSVESAAGATTLQPMHPNAAAQQAGAAPMAAATLSIAHSMRLPPAAQPAATSAATPAAQSAAQSAARPAAAQPVATSAGQPAAKPRAQSAMAAVTNHKCGRELGRWVTPFRRRGGRWLTDVTPLRGLFTSNKCIFQMQAPAWAGEWVPSLSLRFSGPAVSPSAAGAGAGGEDGAPASAWQQTGNSAKHSGRSSSDSVSGSSRSSSGSSSGSAGSNSFKHDMILHRSSSKGASKGARRHSPNRWWLGAQGQSQPRPLPLFPMPASKQVSAALPRTHRIMGTAAGTVSDPDNTASLEGTTTQQQQDVWLQLNNIQKHSQPPLDASLRALQHASAAIAINSPHSNKRCSKAMLPSATVPLFDGGTFDELYNWRQASVRFETPQNLCRALLVATISGHGSDEYNCAEFCETTHVFGINGANSSIAFSNAGTERGCTKQVADGAMPNEHGTWLYGRGGWCDGQQVSPWVLDITTWLRPPGHHNSLTYSATLNGGLQPCQHDQPGYIMMQSSLVLYVAPSDALSGQSISTQDSTLNAAV